ncbi:MAG: DNA-binding protein [Planctomycetes bacterium RBG_13_60_9]|nr:MAG: DNA-binding protein [Planctomycetes bacterium RBG_13_60_9]
MKVPLEIAFKGIKHTDEIDTLIREEADKIQRVCSYMISCRVAIEKRQEHQEVGNPYRVRIDMTVPPGHELVVKREPSKGDMHDPLEMVIKHAFNAAARRLRKLVEQQRGAVKSHPDQQVTAVVHRLFPEQQYGFLRTVDTQEEIYFHKNSVLHHDFDRLAVGMGVRYTAEQGEKGLQATSVQLVDVPRTPVEAPFRG